MKEWGLFADDGMVEGGFLSESEALAVRDSRYHPDDELEAWVVCSDHPEQPSDACEECSC